MAGQFDGVARTRLLRNTHRVAASAQPGCRRGNRGSRWLRLCGQGFFNYILLAKEQLTPACVEVKSLNSSYFERILHLYETEPQSRSLLDFESLLGNLRRVLTKTSCPLLQTQAGLPD